MSPWTPELIERLRAGWAAGESARAIARNLNMNANQIIGKAHRLRLPPRKSPLTNRVRKYVPEDANAEVFNLLRRMGFPAEDSRVAAEGVQIVLEDSA